MGHIDTMQKNFVSTGLIVGIIAWDEYIFFYNQEKIINKQDMVLISIHDPLNDHENGGYVEGGRHHPESKIEGFHDVIQMNFWDIEEGFGRYDPISPEQGKQLRDFILKNKEKQFLIHCEAGQSRSAGIGLAVECLVEYGGDRKEFARHVSAITQHGRYDPNLTVYNAII